MREVHLFTLDAGLRLLLCLRQRSVLLDAQATMPCMVFGPHILPGQGFGERPNKQERIFLSIACKNYPEIRIANNC